MKHISHHVGRALWELSVLWSPPDKKRPRRSEAGDKKNTRQTNSSPASRVMQPEKVSA